MWIEGNWRAKEEDEVGGGDDDDDLVYGQRKADEKGEGRRGDYSVNRT